MTNHAPNNTVISTYAYTLDGVGNRTRTDLNEPMMPSYNAETINYTYTQGNILASAAEGGPLANGNAYTHDANGNRSQKATSVGTTYYTYDSLNRLTQTSTNSRQIQYVYNGLGQRIGKIDNGVQTNYLIDPNGILPQVLAETDANNNLISFYVYDGAGLVAKITPSNQYYFYHYDGLGSTIAITDGSGQVVNTYCYSPEGLVGVQETIPNPFTYVGRFGVMAEGNGLYYMRARYYDPETGRFINKDPIGYAGGLNLFAYVGNSLINGIDPWGLWHANVHSGINNPNFGTYIWSRQVGLSDAQAKIIANGNNAVDNYFGWAIVAGVPGRHFNTSMGGSVDTRDIFAKFDLELAIMLYRQGDSCRAFKILGRGLHSVQDKVAHGSWPFIIPHPNWIDEPAERPMALKATELATKKYLNTFLERINK